MSDEEIDKNKQKIDEIFDILKEINNKHGRKVNDDLLRSIISIVINNPLEADRLGAQEQIDCIIKEYINKYEDGENLNDGGD